MQIVKIKAEIVYYATTAEGVEYKKMPDGTWYVQNASTKAWELVSDEAVKKELSNSHVEYATSSGLGFA